MELATIRVPLKLEWPEACRAARIEGWVFNSPREVLAYVLSIDPSVESSVRALCAIFQSVIFIDRANRSYTGSIVGYRSSNRLEAAAFREVLNLVQADMLLREGYAYPPRVGRVDKKDRSVLTVFTNASLQRASPAYVADGTFEEQMHGLIPVAADGSGGDGGDGGDGSGDGGCEQSSRSENSYHLILSMRILLSHNVLNEHYITFSMQRSLASSFRIPLPLLFSRLAEVAKDQAGAWIHESLREGSNLGMLLRSYWSIIEGRVPRMGELDAVPPSIEGVEGDGAFMDRLPVTLFRHQRFSLASMLRIEQRSIRDQLYENLGGYVYSPILNTFKQQPRQAEEASARGGLFCDSTGLGKTLTTLCLAASTASDGPTLCVVPLSVMAQWKEEANRFRTCSLLECAAGGAGTHSPRTFRCYAYYGQTRVRSPSRLAENTVIVTTYTLLQRDFMKLNSQRLGLHNEIPLQESDPRYEALTRESPLHFVDFQRVVYDESHKNISYTNMLCLKTLRARKRWCISATPLGDGATYEALRQQLSALGLAFEPRVWNHHLMLRGAQHPAPALPPAVLGILRHLMVRTTEERANAANAANTANAASPTLMPAVVVETIPVSLSPERQVEYRNIHMDTLRYVELNARSGAATTRSFNRLRQWISAGGHIDTTDLMVERPLALREDERQRVIAARPLEESCPICFDTEPNPCILPCFHSVCYACLTHMTRHNRLLCPLCRQPVTSRMVRTWTTMDRLASATPSITGGLSAKMSALIHYVQHSNDTRKLVLFTEFRDVHSELARVLPQENITVLTLNGSMTSSSRARVIRDFETTQERVLLTLSIRACAVGINLQAADTCIFFEPMLLKSNEQQGIGRVKRIGQASSTVRVVHIITTGTIEEHLHQTTTAWKPSVASLIQMLSQ
jgi:superfamily II DNA or RNA helicase